MQWKSVQTGIIFHSTHILSQQENCRCFGKINQSCTHVALLSLFQGSRANTHWLNCGVNYTSGFPATVFRRTLNMNRTRSVIYDSASLSSSSSQEYHSQYYEFTGVSGCWDVVHLHRLLWASVVLNVLSLFLGIITAAILGAYKDMVSPEKSKKTRVPRGRHRADEGF